MPSLFVHQTPKRGRVCLMLGASLLLHGGIVGIAALWLQPEPQKGSVVTDIWLDEGGNPPPASPSLAAPEPPEPTSSPDVVVDQPIPTPPESTEDPDFAQIPTPIPPPRRATPSRAVTAVRTTSPQPDARSAATGQPPTGMPGGPSIGAANVAAAWVMPHPPYPHVSAGGRPTGSTTVRIITDASGRVSNVVIVKSTGNPLLDNQTQIFVRMNWHGPPNASRTTEFVYEIR